MNSDRRVPSSVTSSKSRSHLRENSKNRRKKNVKRNGSDLPLKKVQSQVEKDRGNLLKNKSKKNRFADSFTINYSSVMKKIENEKGHKKKKSNLSALMEGKGNPAFLKQMRELYKKEVENRKVKNATSIHDLDKSPKRQMHLDSEMEDGLSQASDFSSFSKSRKMKSKGSVGQLGSFNRRKGRMPKPSTFKRGNRSESMNSFQTSENDFSYARGETEIEMENDEFIEIQGIANKKGKDQKKKRKKGQNSKSKGGKVTGRQ